MVGIFKKFMQIVSVVKNNAHFLNYIAPGLGEVVGSVANVVGRGASAANNIYNSYKSAKESGKKLGFTEGLAAGLQGFMSPEAPAKMAPEGPARTMTKDIGELDERVILKN
jgi:hypothetical protein